MSLSVEHGSLQKGDEIWEEKEDLFEKSQSWFDMVAILGAELNIRGLHPRSSSSFRWN